MTGVVDTEVALEGKKSEERLELWEKVGEESKMVELTRVEELSKMVELWDTGGAAPRPVMVKGALP